MSLVEHTLFGVVDKVQIAIDRIRQFEPPEGYYVAFSGGKDSCVVKDLVKRAGVKADYHYNLTTVDPPELVYFIREHHADVEVHKPKLSMWQLIPKFRLPPLRHMRYCCAVLKEGGGKGRLVVTGVRWAESSRRAKRGMVEQCMSDNSKRYLHPIIDWQQEDIWQYIHENNLPYCHLYDDGYSRLGCIMCPMKGADGMKRDAERWPTYAKMYRLACHKAWEQIIATRSHDRIEKLKFWDGDSMYAWWISDKPEKVDPDQTVMFE